MTDGPLHTYLVYPNDKGSLSTIENDLHLSLADILKNPKTNPPLKAEWAQNIEALTPLHAHYLYVEQGHFDIAREFIFNHADAAIRGLKRHAVRIDEIHQTYKRLHIKSSPS